MRCFLRFGSLMIKKERILFILVMVFHAFVVLFFGYAREIRLFYFPLYLLIPFAANGLANTLQSSRLNIVSNFNKINLMLIAVFITLLFSIFFMLHFTYSPSIAKTSEISFEIVFSITLTASLFIWIMKPIKNLVEDLTR